MDKLFRLRMDQLCADDHAILREGIKSLLAKRDNIEIVAEATNGREAMNRVAQFRPDVVVLDISMPLMDGLEATRQIKKARIPKYSS